MHARRSAAKVVQQTRLRKATRVMHARPRMEAVGVSAVAEINYNAYERSRR